MFQDTKEESVGGTSVVEKGKLLVFSLNVKKKKQDVFVKH